MTRILLAGLLGALVAFAWSAVLHMNPLTGPLGLSMLNEKEDAVLAELRSHDLSPGLYFFPGMDMSKMMLQPPILIRSPFIERTLHYGNAQTH